ncbi:MAG TPA: 50S ribosomal protein L32 [Candidatus Paceibacterota bacterium]
MVVRMRSTRSHTGHRRSHHALKEPRLAKCANCNTMHLRHRLCENCGKYRGRLVVDVLGLRAKKEKKQKEKASKEAR